MPDRRWDVPGWVWIAAAVLAGVGAGLVAQLDIAMTLVVAGVGAAVVALVSYDLRFGILLMLAVLPLDVFGRVSQKPLLTAYQAVLLLTLLIWIWRIPTGESKRAPFGPVDAWLVALLLAGLWSLPFSMATDATLFALARLAFIVVFFRLISAYATEPGFVRQMLAVIAVTAVASSAIAYLQHSVPGFTIGNAAVGLGTGQAPIVRGAAFFDDPNYLGAVLAVVVAVGVAAAFSEKRLVRSLAWLAIAGACVPGLYATLSRSAWVGAAAGVAVAIVVVPGRRRYYLGGAVALALAATLALQPSLLLERAGSITSGDQDQSVATRLYMFDSAIEMIKDNWAVGVGLNAFEEAYPVYRDLRAEATIVRPHEIPLAIWAETGVAGLVAQVGLTIAVLLALLRGMKRGLPFEGRLAIVGLGALIVQTLFQNLLYFEYLWFFLALCVATLRERTSTEEVPA